MMLDGKATNLPKEICPDDKALLEQWATARTTRKLVKLRCRILMSDSAAAAARLGVSKRTYFNWRNRVARRGISSVFQITSQASIAARFTKKRGQKQGRRKWEGSTGEERSSWGRRTRLLRRNYDRKRPLQDLWGLLATCTPSPAETQAMIEDLLVTLGQPKVTALTGISRTHLAVIRKGRNLAGASSRKYVWVIWCGCFHPTEPLSGFAIATCNRFSAAAAPHHAGKVASEARDRAP